MKKKLVALTLATAMEVTSLTIPGGEESTNEELVNAGTYTVDVEISNATSWGKALRGNYTSDYLYLGTVTVNRANAENLTVKSDGRGNLTAGNKLKIVKINKKGEQVLFNATTYKVSGDGSLALDDLGTGTYEVVESAEAKAITKAVLATVKVAKTTATVKEGGKAAIKLAKSLNKANVQKIKYVSTKKSIATVNKAGKITAKKAGIVTIKAKVTLKNGKTKVVKMKVNVKG